MRVVIVIAFAISFLFSGCALFQSRVNDQTRTLRTRSTDPVWDLELWELPAASAQDLAPPLEDFQDSGRYYSFQDQIISAMINYHVDSIRIAANRSSSRKELDEWYATVRPHLFDSLNAKYPWKYHRFEGELHFTNDTTWRWLGDQDSFETCQRSMTLVQLLKPGHWYLFVFDSEGPTQTIGRGHYAERHVSFYLDPQRQVLHWSNTRKRVKKMRIV